MLELTRTVEPLFNYLGVSLDKVEEKWNEGVVSLMKGNDGKDYIWYNDEEYNVALNVATGVFVSDAYKILGLFC